MAGLHLDPSEVKDFVESWQKILTSYVGELEQALVPLAAIIESDALVGKTYAVYKTHMQNHFAVVTSLITQTNEYIAACDKIYDIVGNEVLDEDDLNEFITTYTKHAEITRERMNTYRQRLTDPLYATAVEPLVYDIIRELEGLEAHYEDMIAKLKQKLDLLYEIDDNLSAYVFELKDIYTSVEDAIYALEGSWDGNTPVIARIDSLRKASFGMLLSNFDLKDLHLKELLRVQEVDREEYEKALAKLIVFKPNGEIFFIILPQLKY